MTGGATAFQKMLHPFHIGRVLGVPLRIHPSTVLVWALVAWAGLAIEGAILFGSVLLHEGAHAWIARVRGLDVYVVDLLPFGGAARMEPGVWSPADECVVAIAGPCMNLGIAGALFAGGTALGGWQAAAGWAPGLLGWSSSANLLLAAFNLLPLLPLDGGRLLRCALVGIVRMGVYEAAHKLSRLSRALAVLLGLVGLFGLWQGTLNVSWIVVALFLYRAAGQEEESAALGLLRQAARPSRRIRGSGARSVRAFAVPPETSVGAALHAVRRGGSVLLVVDEDGLVLGTLLEGDVWDGAAQHGLTAPLARLLRD